MANTFLTVPQIAKAMLAVVRNEGVLLDSVNRQFDSEFKGGTGDYCNVLKPVRYILGDGADITNDIQTITQKYTTLQITEHKHLAISPTRKEMTLDIKDFAKQFLANIGLEFAEHMDYKIGSLFDEVYYNAGTPGTTPSAFSDMTAVARVADRYAIPQRGRVLVVNEDAKWGLADALKGTFDASLAKDSIRTGDIGIVGNMRVKMDQNVNKFTSGTCTGTPVVDTVDGVTYITGTGGSVETSTLHTDGWTGTLKEGDIITIGSVYGLNPANRQSTGTLQPFVVRALCTGATDSPLTISPAIIISGPYQNVDAAPVAEATITVITQAVQDTATSLSAQNLCFHPDAFTLACVPLADVPDGQGVDTFTMNYEGLAITVTKGFDILTGRFIIRFDLMYGVKAINPALAVRMLA